MPISNPKYDVAISFLTRDLETASALNQRLSEGLDVFFYPRKQDELAGTNGLETMRTPFVDDSRVMVVLFRERWGETPWTRVESTAIQDACLKHGFGRLFFIVMDKNSAIPHWVPSAHVRFNYEDFGLDEAVGAIKARVIEQGGHPQPMSPLKRAEQVRNADAYRTARIMMNSAEGTKKVFEAVRFLFKEIEAQCQTVNEAEPLVQICCTKHLVQGELVQSCSIFNDFVTLAINWYQPIANSLDSSELRVSELLGRPALSGQFHVVPPKQLHTDRYCADLSLAMEYGWAKKNTKKFMSSDQFAQQLVIQFLDLVEKHRRGELPSIWDM